MNTEALKVYVGGGDVVDDDGGVDGDVVVVGSGGGSVCTESILVQRVFSSRVQVLGSPS